MHLNVLLVSAKDRLSFSYALQQLVTHHPSHCRCCPVPLLCPALPAPTPHPLFPFAPGQVAKLMIPHFRYTLNINCNARQSLINEGGTIESAFTPGGYAIRLSSAAYKLWRFTLQALPTELTSRWGQAGAAWHTAAVATCESLSFSAWSVCPQRLFLIIGSRLLPLFQTLQQSLQCPGKLPVPLWKHCMALLGICGHSSRDDSLLSMALVPAWHWAGG